MHAEARGRALRADRRVTDDGAAGLARDLADVAQRHRLVLAGVLACRADLAVLPGHGFLRDLPELCRALAGLLDDRPRRLDGRHAAREGRAAAASEEVVAERARVRDDRADLVDVDLQLLCRHHAERGAQAADVRRAGHERERAVLVELERHGRLAADVEPEAGRDAATLVWAERRLPVVALLGGFEALDEADGPELRSVSGLRAFLGGVLEPEIDRIDTELLGQLVDDALDAVGRDRATGSTVRRNLRAVRHHVEADDLHVLEVVVGEGAHARRLHRAALESTGLQDDLALGGRDATVLLGAHLHADGAARGGAGRFEDFLTAHDHLDGPVRLLRERQRKRLEVDHRFAAEPAADLR